jgi:hypothetical protein
MVNYQQGKIYRLVCNTTGLVYVGSTCEPTLARRLQGHRDDFRKVAHGKKLGSTSFKILENNNFEIILIENCPCDSKDELHRRERFYIESMECVNKIVPCRTPKEYREANKEKAKEYHENNKEKMKEYREANKEKLKEYQRKYRESKKNAITLP